MNTEKPSNEAQSKPSLLGDVRCLLGFHKLKHTHKHLPISRIYECERCGKVRVKT